MPADAAEILDRYLRELESQLAGLPASDRAEIVLEVRDHFEEARRRLPDPTAADLMNILERLGSPQAIAEEARSRSTAGGAPPPAPALATPPAAYTALEVITLVAWVFWWPLAVVLGAISTRWSRRDKAIAILIELVLLALAAGTVSQTYVSSAGAHWAFTAILFVFPPTVHGIFSAGFLAWKLRHPEPQRWSTPWQVAGRAALIAIGLALVWLLVLGPSLLLFLHSR